MKRLHIATPKYSSVYHFPDDAACASVLEAAIARGCEEIVVEPEGQRSRTYTVKEVQARVEREKTLAVLTGLAQLKDAPNGDVARFLRRVQMRPFLPNKPGTLIYS